MDAKTSFMKQLLSADKAFGLPIPIVPFSDWKYYYITKPLTWKSESSFQIDVNIVKVPEGFVTDLASIPQLFWQWIPPMGPYGYAAIVHDFLYWEQYTDRSSADKIFYLGMNDLKVSKFKSIPIYNAVKIAGGIAWQRNKSKRENGERRVLSKFPSTVDTSWEEWKSISGVFSDASSR